MQPLVRGRAQVEARLGGRGLQVFIRPAQGKRLYISILFITASMTPCLGDPSVRGDVGRLRPVSRRRAVDQQHRHQALAGREGAAGRRGRSFGAGAEGYLLAAESDVSWDLLCAAAMVDPFVVGLPPFFPGETLERLWTFGFPCRSVGKEKDAVKSSR